jgi:hypothetical protein
MTEILKILFSRLQSSRTLQYLGYLLEFFSVFMTKYGLPPLISYTDKVTQDVFWNIFLSFWLPSANKVPGSTERKAIGVGSMLLLHQYQPLLQDPRMWGQTLDVAVSLFTDTEENAGYQEFEEDALGLEETGGFSSAFAQLVYTGANDDDFFPEINGPAFLAQQIGAISRDNSQMVRILLWQCCQTLVSITFLTMMFVPRFS